MSVVLPIEVDSRYRIYTATAGQTTFSVPFPFQDNADIAAYALNTTTLDYVEISNSLYTLTGAGNPTGGSLVFATGRPVGEKVVVIGTAVLERLSSIVRNGRFSSVLIDDELDRNRIIQQELKRDVRRAVKMEIDAGAGLIVQAGLEDGQTLIKQGNNLVAGPDVTTIEDAITFRDEAAASAADAAASASDALLSKMAASSSAAYAAEVAATFNGQRTLPLTGAVNRTLVSVSQDNVVNAKEFGIAYDGSNETSKLQAALSAMQTRGGGVLVIDGQIDVFGGVTVGNGVYILGTGRRKARIVQHTAGADTFIFGGTQSRISGLTIVYDTQGTGGAAAMRFTGPVNCAHDFEIYYAAVGVRQIANDIRVSDFRIIDCTTSPILIGGAADGSTGAIQGWYSDGVCYGDVATSKSALGNLRLQNNANSISFMNMKFLGGLYPVTTDATTFQTGLCPAWCEFVNCHFDGARNTGNLNKIIGASFTNCWISGGREDAVDALILNSCLGLMFTNTRIVNCGMNGIRVTPQCLSLTMIGVHGFDCGASPSAVGLVIGAIRFEDGANGFVVQGAQGGNGWVTYSTWSGKQTHTVVVGAGCSSFEVNAKNRGNLTGAVYQGTAAGATEVYSNCF